MPPAKKRTAKREPSEQIERSTSDLKKVNMKEARRGNKGLLQDKFDEQVEELIKFLFDKLKSKETQKIDRNALMRAITSLGLWNDIFEEDITDMLELFSPEGDIDYDTMKEIFMKCKINVKAFMDD